MLYPCTKELWNEECEALSARWAADVRAAAPLVEAAGDQFHEWQPLRFYVSVNAVSGAAKVVFSVRYCGQEVAKVKVGNEPRLQVSPKHAEHNARDFDVSTAPGSWPWDSKEASHFRSEFRKRRAKAGSGDTGRVEEHAYESRILIEMEGETRATKFAGTLANIRHVGLTDQEYPFQCPTPLSASSGSPKRTRGNIDILARRGRGRSVRLSVWELKRPGCLAEAPRQVYIYCVTLALMLRGKGGPDWYQVFGFSSPVPDRLELEGVVAVTADQRSGLERAARDLGEIGTRLELEQERAAIHLYAAYYDPTSLAIELEPLRLP
jgi:hypothetical protein